MDYDNDGWMDLFVLSGTRLEGAPAGTSNRLYKNNRDGTFTDVTRQAASKQLDGRTPSAWATTTTMATKTSSARTSVRTVSTATWAMEPSRTVTREAGLLDAGNRWGAGCSFVDYNRDGHLDLFVSNYLQFDFKKVPAPGSGVNCNFKGIPIECGPADFPSASTRSTATTAMGRSRMSARGRESAHPGRATA